MLWSDTSLAKALNTTVLSMVQCCSALLAHTRPTMLHIARHTLVTMLYGSLCVISYHVPWTRCEPLVFVDCNAVADITGGCLSISVDKPECMHMA